MFLWPLLFIAVSSPADWRERPKVQKKVQTQRRVFVVLKEKAGQPGVLSLTGIGEVKQSRSVCLQKMLGFEKLPQVSSHFKKVIHQPKLSRVYFVLQAYGYEARLLIKYKVVSTKEKDLLQWSVVWGRFEGMVGEIQLTSPRAGRVQALMTGSFRADQVPLPSFFKNFVLEMIIHRISLKMRTYLERRGEP